MHQKINTPYHLNAYKGFLLSINSYSKWRSADYKGNVWFYSKAFCELFSKAPPQNLFAKRIIAHAMADSDSSSSGPETSTNERLPQDIFFLARKVSPTIFQVGIAKKEIL
jgi:hypothetical protein